MDDDAVFRALGNPTRRSILDRLRSGPLTTGDLAAAHPDLSRFAVMQHLGVLTTAGLVVVRRRGRQRFNHLNAVPLRRVYERWVGTIAGASAEELLALSRHIERGIPMSEIRTVRVENEIRFKATPERVFAAMTTESLQWFPHTYGEERVVGIVCEPRAGGLLREDWGDGHGHVYGIIQVWDPPHTYTTRAWLGLGVMLDTETTITDDGDGTLLKVSKVAVGPLTDDEARGIRMYGGLENFETALRAWIER
ncbi:MAG TPA: metalloregulator ArsR/SmtB family transcription factor [Acidimicrobiia bacterium]|nr:metalloregulator ArsR/SmtB family transcription factor [Acidimicrobiia bacterium]